MLKLIESSIFSAWLARLKDDRDRGRILARLERVRHENFGDHKSVGGGIEELRLHFGAGYRIYFIRSGTEIVVLLAGGSKSSQEKDIAKARTIAKQWTEK